MTSDRGVDQITRAWLDLMPDEAPDRMVDAVLQAIERTPQVRTPLERVPWRFPRMSRITLVTAAAAAVVLGVVGMAVIVDPMRGPGVGGPTASPIASAPGGSQSPSFDTSPLPDAMELEWVAEVGPIAELGNTDSIIRLVVSNDLAVVQVETNSFGNVALHSVSAPAPAGEITLLTDVAGVGCAVGDEGTYRWSLSSNGVVLTLEAIADDCSARSATLARAWTHAVDGRSRGGRGVVATFDPPFLVTLAEGAYATDRDSDSAQISTADRRLVAVRDPWGLSRPCSASGGDKLPIAASADDFEAYARTLPGVTIESSELEIDGHRTVHLAMQTRRTSDCPDGTVQMWTPKIFTSLRTWSVNQGDPASVYLVEVGADLVLLQWQGTGVSPADELEVLSTVDFLEALPAIP